MCQLEHPNVLTPIGICVDVEVPYLIMPLMERGSLLMYLRKERDQLFMPDNTNIEQVYPYLAYMNMSMHMCKASKSASVIVCKVKVYSN